MEARPTSGIALTLFAALTWLAPGAGLGAATTHKVLMEGTSFDPPSLTVKAGDTVVWINKDPFPHTATSQDAHFDSRNIAPNKSWKYKARKTGVFAYVCTLHPTMKGTLRVE